jgi:long-subunit acyl-CoA synthetase (AMP-forming)
MLFQAISEHARQQADAIALQDAGQSLSYEALIMRVMQFSSGLRRSGMHSFGLLADNSVDWVVADLAVLFGNTQVTPLLAGLSSPQMMHAIRETGMEAVLTDTPEKVEALLEGQCERIDAPFAGRLTLLRLHITHTTKPHIPAHTGKVSYVGGPDGRLMGACLSRMALENVAQSLFQVTHASPGDRHLSLLPLTDLMETVGGVYVTLLAGASACLLPVSQAAADAPHMLQALRQQGAVTASLHAQQLPALLVALRAGAEAPAGLRRLTVSGGPLSAALLDEARQLGLPVFEAYSLTESASVVAINTPEGNQPGSVGKPLQHIKIRIAPDGEIVVGGALFEGYLGGHTAKPGKDGMWHTGDLGHLDSLGYLHLTGRKA